MIKVRIDVKVWEAENLFEDQPYYSEATAVTVIQSDYGDMLESLVRMAHDELMKQTSVEAES